MFKGFNNRQQHGFPNLNFGQNIAAYNFNNANFWLDASFGTSTNINGASVASWIDKINGVIASESTASLQPNFTSSNSAYNNLPTLVSKGANTRMSLNTQIPFQTICIIANYNIISTINRACGISSSTSTSYAISFGGTTAGVNGITYVGTLGVQSGTTENTSPKIAVISKNGIVVNSIIENSSTIAIESWALSQIFGSENNTTVGLNGNIAEIITWPYEFSQSMMQNLCTNINQKYAIY